MCGCCLATKALLSREKGEGQEKVSQEGGERHCTVKRKRVAHPRGKGGKKSKSGVEKMDPESQQFIDFVKTVEASTKSSDEEMETTVPDDNDHVDDEEEYVSEIE